MLAGNVNGDRVLAGIFLLVMLDFEPCSILWGKTSKNTGCLATPLDIAIRLRASVSLPVEHSTRLTYLPRRCNSNDREWYLRSH